MSPSHANAGGGFDPQAFCPAQAPDVLVFDRGGEEPDSRYLIIHPVTNAYLVLSENEQVLWSMFDGKLNVQEICTKYLEAHGTLVLTRVYTLLHRLGDRGLLVREPQFACPAPGARKPRRVFRLHYLFGVKLPGTDRLIRLLGWFLRCLNIHSIPVLSLFILTIVAGIYLAQPSILHNTPLLRTAHTYELFRHQSWWRVGIRPGPDATDLRGAAPTVAERPDHELIYVFPRSFGWGLLLLLLSHLTVSFIRETFRSAVVAGYTGRAPPLRLIVNYGIPAFRSFTPWHMSLPRRKRLACAVSGMLLELAAAPVLLIILRLTDHALAVEVLRKFVWILYARTFFHLAPLAGSDIHSVFGEWSNLNNFRQRAFGFLRSEFLNSVLADRPLNREERFYVTFNVLAMAWMLLLAYLSVHLFEAHGQELRGFLLHVRGIPGFLTFVFVMILALPVLVSMILAIAWSLHRFWHWLMAVRVLQPSINFIGMTTVITVIGAFFLELVGRQNIITPRLHQTLLTAIGLVILLGSMYQAGKNLQHEKRSYARTKLLALFGLYIAVAAAMFAQRYALSRDLFLPVLGLLGMAAWIYLLLGIVTGQHMLARWATPYGPPELSTAFGCLLMLLAAVLQGVALLRETHFASFLLLLIMGLALVSAGQIAWLRALTRVQRCGYSLAINPHSSPARNLINAANYILDRLGQITRIHFGEAEMKKLETLVRTECPINDFSFKEPYFPIQTEPLELGEIYREMILAAYEGLGRRHSWRFANAAMEQVFRQVHWQGKCVLNEYLLKQTAWADRFHREMAIDLPARRTMLNGVSMFEDLPSKEKDILIQYMSIEHYASGESVLDQGGLGDSSYIIVAGEVQVEERDLSGEIHILGLLREGDFFGEAALLGKVKRVATIRATAQVVVLCLQKNDFGRFELRCPDAVKLIRERLLTYQTILRIPLFSDLPTNLLRGLLPQIASLVVPPGEDIIKEGEPGDLFYLIKSGSVSVVRYREDGSEQKLATLGPRDYFGEIALLKDIPRTATVRSESETELFTIKANDFQRLLSSSRLFLVNLSAVGEVRLLA